jgi:hypothetical protein
MRGAFVAEEVRIWPVDKSDALTEIKRSKLDREARIEKWISSDISLLSPDLLIIGEQVETASGNFIDRSASTVPGVWSSWNSSAI